MPLFLQQKCGIVVSGLIVKKAFLILSRLFIHIPNQYLSKLSPASKQSLPCIRFFAHFHCEAWTLDNHSLVTLIVNCRLCHIFWLFDVLLLKCISHIYTIYTQILTVSSNLFELCVRYDGLIRLFKLHCYVASLHY